MTAKEYAAACGEWSQADVGTDDNDFVSWVVQILQLQPPPELQDFHDARAGQYVLQTKVHGNTVEVVGPNADTQFWYDIEVTLVAEMPRHLGQTLVESGCLNEGDMELAKQVMAATNRMQQDDFFEPATLEEYLQSCVDIKMTAPVMDSMDAFFEHFIDGWGRLNPLLQLEDYHSAVLRLYLGWQRVGDIASIDHVTIQDVNDEALKLGDTFVGKLVTSGCSG